MADSDGGSGRWRALDVGDLLGKTGGVVLFHADACSEPPSAATKLQELGQPPSERGMSENNRSVRLASRVTFGIPIKKESVPTT